MGMGTYPPQEPHPSRTFELSVFGPSGPHNVVDGFAPVMARQPAGCQSAADKYSSLSFLGNVNSLHVRYMLSPVSLSVCRLSVTIVHPTQAVVTFGNFPAAFGTFAIH